MKNKRRKLSHDNYHICNLPIDLLKHHICPNLSFTEKCNLRLASKFFYTDIFVYPLWKQYVQIEHIRSYNETRKTLPYNIYGIYSIFKILLKSHWKTINMLQHITHLDMSDTVFTDEHMKLMPPSVKILNCGSCTTFMFKYLPDSILHLKVEHVNVYKITETRFPSRLESLELTGSRLNGVIIDYLPTTLTSLTISFVSDMFSLDSLPQSLTGLYLYGEFFYDEKMFNQLFPKMNKSNLKGYPFDNTVCLIVGEVKPQFFWKKDFI